MHAATKFAPVLLVVTLGVAACGSTSATDVATNQPTTTKAATTAGSSGAPSTSVAAAKVSANDASQAEIVAALAAAGVPNAERWADEIVEYRPYDTSDPTFAKLRSELAKYKPGAGVVDQIIAVLGA